MASHAKETVFSDLKAMLEKYSSKLVCTENTSEAFNLNTGHIMKNKRPLYFGGVKLNKSNVSYHLMPIYVFPELHVHIGPKLKPLLKGKSCFNIKQLGDDIIGELNYLTDMCYEKYETEGFI